MIEPAFHHEITGWAATRRRAGHSKMIIAGSILLGAFAVLAFAHPVLTATVWADRPDIYRPVTGHDTSISHPSGPRSPIHSGPTQSAVTSSA